MRIFFEKEIEKLQLFDENLSLVVKQRVCALCELKGHVHRDSK